MVTHEALYLSPKVSENTQSTNSVSSVKIHTSPDYKLEKVDNCPKIQFLTAQISKAAHEAFKDHREGNWVLDLPPYQLEKREARYGQEGDREYLVGERGQHIASVSHNLDERPGKLTFGINRAITDGKVLNQLIQHISTVCGKLEEFAKRPEDFTAPVVSKVNGLSYGSKVLCQLDYLHLKTTVGEDLEFDDDDLCQVGAYTVHKSNGRAKIYTDKAEVWHNGKHVFNYLWGADKFGLEGTAKLEVTNPTLYDGGIFVPALVMGFLDLIAAEVIQPFRLDVAFDGAGVINFMEDVHQRKIVAVRKATYHKMKKIVGVADDKIEGFTYGTRGGGRYVRCYNKTKELREKPKPYISDGHTANGLTGTVGRLEAEMRWAYLKTLQGFKWTDLFDREKLARLGMDALSGWFDWVTTPKEGEDQKLSRRFRSGHGVQILKFETVKTKGYARVYAKPVKSDRMARIRIKRCILDAESATTDADAIGYLKTAVALIEGFSLWQWLRKYRSEDFDKEIRKRARLEDRSLSPRFFFGGCLEALDAVTNYLPCDVSTGEVASGRALNLAA